MCFLALRLAPGWHRHLPASRRRGPVDTNAGGRPARGSLAASLSPTPLEITPARVPLGAQRAGSHSNMPWPSSADTTTIRAFAASSPRSTCGASTPDRSVSDRDKTARSNADVMLPMSSSRSESSLSAVVTKEYSLRTPPAVTSKCHGGGDQSHTRNSALALSPELSCVTKQPRASARGGRA